MTESPAQLDYAPPPPLHRRRSFKRALVAITLLAVVACAWIFIPRAWHATQLLAQQRQAMRHVLSPDIVVYEPDRDRAAKLWVEGSPYIRRPPGGAFHVPQIAGGEFLGDAVFLHGLRRPDGARRLVEVEVYTPVLHSREARLHTYVVTPATFMNPRIGGFDGDHDAPPGPPGQPRRPRLFAGQPDPNDPSRFTMRYEYPDRSGVMHGRLTDDDTIEFEWTVDEKPTTQPTTRP